MWKCSALIFNQTFRKKSFPCRVKQMLHTLMMKWLTSGSHFNFCSIFMKRRQRISVTSCVFMSTAHPHCYNHPIWVTIIALSTERNCLTILYPTRFHPELNVLPPPSTHIYSWVILPLPPTPLLFTVNWGRSWTRRAVAASCCHGRVASTSAAASAAARPSHSCSTPSASAATATTTSARPAGSTTSRTEPGCAPPARRAGNVVGSSGDSVVIQGCVCVCMFVCACVCVYQEHVAKLRMRDW